MRQVDGCETCIPMVRGLFGQQDERTVTCSRASESSRRSTMEGSRSRWN